MFPNSRRWMIISAVIVLPTTTLWSKQPLHTFCAYITSLLLPWWWTRWLLQYMCVMIVWNEVIGPTWLPAPPAGDPFYLPWWWWMVSRWANLTTACTPWRPFYTNHDNEGWWVECYDCAKKLGQLDDCLHPLETLYTNHDDEWWWVESYDCAKKLGQLIDCLHPLETLYTITMMMDGE